VYESQGDKDRAVDFYRRAIASNKGYAEAYANLGKLYLREGRLGEAIALLREAVTIRADFAFGYNGLAEAYSRIGLQGDALIAVRKAIELDPKAADHLATLGTVELEMELIDRAEASFRRALELDAGYPEARLGLAEVARRRADYEAAVREIDAALADPRTDALARARLATQRDSVAREGAESSELSALVEAGTAPPEAIQRLAAIYGGRHEWSRAAELQARVPAEGIERERLAYYLLKAGKRREALELYTALAQGSERADFEVNAGVAQAGLGNDRAAIEAYARALAIEPENPRARLYYANSLVRLGRTDEAAERYRKYLAEHPNGAAAERVRKILDRIAPASNPGAKP
jgi:tetratricopeptide (TPR) repeat protein